jgi:pimeloyl-ACP methyl ester carboxylesterase
MTIHCRHHPAPTGAARTLLVMLPGAGIEAADFAAQGMVAAVHDRFLPVDIIAAKPELDLYLDGDVTAALHRAVIEPALEKHYETIWLLGISLGGMGALLYASAHAEILTGVILLAPFLGTQGTIAAIEDSGGLANGSPGAGATAPEARMLHWLQHRPSRPALYLGYGEADRFARGHRLLAVTLPASHVFKHPGAHEWETWRALWHDMLNSAVFA